MSSKFPEEGPSIYREKESGSYTELPPDILIKRGFNFLGNLPNDTSLQNLNDVVDFELRRLERDLKQRGLPGEDEPRIVISNLDTLIKGSQQVGYEIRLVKGEYNTTSGQLADHNTTVAVFQRFQLDKFLTVKSVEQLTQDGFTFVRNFHLLAWGDNLEHVHPRLRSTVQAENKEIEDFVRTQENAGVRVQLIKGSYNDQKKEIDSGAQVIALFSKQK